MQPFLRVFTKSPNAAVQSILHSLFLPTPFKVLSESTSVPKSNSTPSASKSDADGTSKAASSLLDIPEEVLVPGALYANCAVVVNLTVNKGDIEDIQEEGEVVEYPDDGEYGGELVGRLVWEMYENGLKVWEKENSGPVEEEGGGIGDRKEDRNTGKQTQTNDDGHEVEKDAYL